MIDCNKCRFINMTEDEQNKMINGKKIRHKCTIHNRILLHRYMEPVLQPCRKCNGINFRIKEELIATKQEEKPKMVICAYTEKEKQLARDVITALMKNGNITPPVWYRYSPEQFKEELIQLIIVNESDIGILAGEKNVE